MTKSITRIHVGIPLPAMRGNFIRRAILRLAKRLLHFSQINPIVVTMQDQLLMITLYPVECSARCPVNVYDVEDMQRVAKTADLPPWCAEA